jgi:CBS domain-containing protein
MSVAALLGSKGSNVITVAPDAPVLEVIRILAENKIGSVLILDDGGAIAGIVSERDIVHGMAATGAGLLEAPVSSIMTSEVVTCLSTDSVIHIMEKMTRGRFRHVPVIDEARLIGIVSIGDVVKHRIAEVESDVSAMRSYIATG